MNKNIFRICGLAVASALSLSACQDVLDEQPRSSFDPTFFQTEDGVKGGLTALYSHLRNIYGQAYYYNACETGTDEYTWAQSADGNFKDADLSGVGNLTPNSCRADVIWGQSFSDINTACAVIENADAVGIAQELVAEAKFFRAFHYFNLVQTFGGVPLDLGGGELHSNTAPKRVSERNTVAEVYTKCIFPDFEAALAALPDVSRLPGTVNKTTARLFLAKAYLTYAWWLENPNNIPTYPECQRDKGQASAYFQKAFDAADYAIHQDSKTPNGLEPYFYLANIAQNDRNKEWLLWADHTELSEQYNGGSLGYGSGGAPDNFAGWMVTWNYSGWLSGKNSDGSTIIPVQREASQPLGRPWTRMAASVEGLSKFTNTQMDSRWDGTFTSQYRVNMQKVDKNFTYVEGANGSHIGAYETYLKFLPADVDNTSIVYGEKNAGVQAGEMPGENAWVISVKDVSRSRYPGLWKLGPCRTDYDFSASLGSPNAGSTRPYAIAKFSEFYFIAAEAAVKLGNSKAAKSFLVDIRQRAGRWNYVVNEANPAELFELSGDDLRKLPVIADYSAEMAAATPDDITIDYILDERLREFWGEGYRWFDLVRTQKWAERAGTYTICDEYSLNKKTVSRKIEAFHYLRPIPQGQLDALQMSAEEKKAYQNPGY